MTDRGRWAVRVSLTTVFVGLALASCRCTPRQEPKHPEAPIIAPPPGYGRRIV